MAEIGNEKFIVGNNSSDERVSKSTIRGTETQEKVNQNLCLPNQPSPEIIKVHQNGNPTRNRNQVSFEAQDRDEGYLCDGNSSSTETSERQDEDYGNWCGNQDGYGDSDDEYKSGPSKRTRNYNKPHVTKIDNSASEIDHLVNQGSGVSHSVTSLMRAFKD